MGHRRWRPVAAIAWVAGMLVLSFLPAQDKHDLHTKGRFHTTGHFLAFLLAVVLVAPVARSVRGRLLLVAVIALLGVGVEYTQHAVNHMLIEWTDIWTDLLGVAVGALLLAVAGGLRAEERPDERKTRAC